MAVTQPSSLQIDPFHSVMNVPSSRDLPVRILHLSFRDFLVQSDSKFRVNQADKHKEIAFRCFEIMVTYLRTNFCHLEGPGTRRADIDPHYIRQYFPEELKYACQNWIYHIAHCEILALDENQLRKFLENHFLHWLEGMCLLGLISEAREMLDLLQSVLTVCFRYKHIEHSLNFHREINTSKYIIFCKMQSTSYSRTAR